MHTTSKTFATIGKPAPCSLVSSKFCSLSQREADQLQLRALSFGIRNSRRVVTRCSLLPGIILSYRFRTVSCTIMGRQDEGSSGTFPSSIWISRDRLSVRGDLVWFLTNREVYFS